MSSECAKAFSSRVAGRLASTPVLLRVCRNLSLDPSTGRFVYTIKRGNRYGRAVGLATTTNFYNQSYTDFGVVFGADALDQKLGKTRVTKWLKTCPEALVCTNEFCPGDSAAGREGPCWDEDQFNVDVYNMGVFRCISKRN